MAAACSHKQLVWHEEHHAGHASGSISSFSYYFLNVLIVLGRLTFLTCPYRTNPADPEVLWPVSCEGEAALSHDGPELWNNLPENISAPETALTLAFN